MAAAGYLAPANTEVALSDAFLQLGRAPVHSGVFNNSVKNMRIPPLHRATSPSSRGGGRASRSRQLLEVEVLDLDALTEQIDEASQTVLAPPEATRSRRARGRLATDRLGLRSGSLGSAARSAGSGARPGGWSASRMAWVTTGPASSTCQGRAPSSASAAATAAASDVGVAGGGRGPQHPAQVVGGEQVLDRQLLLLGQRAERLAGQR